MQTGLKQLVRLTIGLKAVAGLDGQQQMLVLKILEVRHEGQELE